MVEGCAEMINKGRMKRSEKTQTLCLGGGVGKAMFIQKSPEQYNTGKYVY